MDIPHRNKFSTSFCVNIDGKDYISHAGVETRSEEIFESSEVCDAAQSQSCSDYHTAHYPVSCNGAVSNKFDEAQIGNGRSITKVKDSSYFILF